MGTKVGDSDGRLLGLPVGLKLGKPDGSNVGYVVGLRLGINVGLHVVGVNVGSLVGL